MQQYATVYISVQKYDIQHTTYNIKKHKDSFKKPQAKYLKILGINQKSTG